MSETLMTDGATTTEAAASQAEGQATQTDTTVLTAEADVTEQSGEKPAEGETKPEADKPAGPRDLGLTQEAAQKLAEKRVAGKAAAEAKALDALKTARQGWVSDLRNDPEIGGDKLTENLAVAKKALQTFDKPAEGQKVGALTQLLNQTGFGDHPEVIRFFTRLGKSISEDRFVPASGSTSQAKQDPVSVLYPNQ